MLEVATQESAWKSCGCHQDRVKDCPLVPVRLSSGVLSWASGSLSPVLTRSADGSAAAPPSQPSSGGQLGSIFILPVPWGNLLHARKCPCFAPLQNEGTLGV